MGLGFDGDIRPGRFQALPVPAPRGASQQPPARVSMRLQEAGWLWSGGTRLDVPGSQFVKLRHRDQKVCEAIGEALMLRMCVWGLL